MPRYELRNAGKLTMTSRLANGQIGTAVMDAVAAVLLVRNDFRSSDYIIEKELPHLMNAHDERGVMIFWPYLEPCDVTPYKHITRFQAMTQRELKPMSKMKRWEWTHTMPASGDMIDEYLKASSGLSLPETPSALLRRSDPSSGSPAGNSERNRAATLLGQRLNSGRATDKYVVCRRQAYVN